MDNEKIKKFVEAVALLELTMDSLDYLVDNKLIKHQCKLAVKRANIEIKKHLDIFYDNVDDDISGQIIDLTILIKKNIEVELIEK
jgi:hypothetical protein